MPERGRAGTGAVLSLSAIGKQDTYLTTQANKEDSFFKPKNLQHTNSALAYRSHIINTNGEESWPFGRTINFDINPKTSGDLLANAWIKLELPQLTGSNAYAQFVGHTLLKEARFSINGVTLDREVSEWMIIHHELLINESGERALHNMVGPENTTSGPLSLLIPLYFFFCRDTNHIKDYDEKFVKPYFYLCCCPEQEITISVEFQPVPYFSNVINTSDIYCSKLNLITQEYNLSQQERHYYMDRKHISLINIVVPQATYSIEKNDQTFRNFLSCPFPVKAFHWFLRNKEVESTSNSFYFNNRYNFSSNLSTTICNESPYPIMGDATIYIGGTQQQVGLQNANSANDKVGSLFYKILQNFDHNLTVPCRNIYTYSFALDEYNPNPSGAVNFNATSSTNTYLNGYTRDETVNNDYSLYLYYFTSQVLKYENGFCSSIFA